MFKKACESHTCNLTVSKGAIAGRGIRRIYGIRGGSSGIMVHKL